ncbi:hypothetical protein SAMN04487968_103118 [Nocardioides terrae]|uniref:4-amino-4-deoxy-L-arabinose transferase n=1 Tax=Nocardioides terrae TaxID=574651 RepID=A0A1I1FU35_9ACTN|nr:hypothetical protein [Nocardioides terrae]SFC02552.1 hypothetical protein SAMN04487968_103118 [Nocardioides terrae]
MTVDQPGPRSPVARDLPHPLARWTEDHLVIPARAHVRARWRRLRAERVLQVAVALIVVQLALRAWALSRSWYTQDDFAFMARMLDDGITPSSLFRPYAGHVMPVPMLVSWLNATFAPFSFLPTAAVIWGMQAVADIGLLMLLVRWFGVRPGILPPLALYLFCVISVPVMVWWAAAANQLPLQIVLFFALQTHVAYLRTRRVRHAWSTAAWLLGGFLFYEKTLFVVGAMGIVSVAYFATGTLAERLRYFWAEHRGVAVLHIVLSASYLLVYYRAVLDFDPAAAASGSLPDVVANMAFRGYLPALLGGPLRWSHTDEFGNPSPGSLGVLVAAVLVVAIVRTISRSRVNSLRAWWLPASFLASNILLVTAGRTSLAGAWLSRDFRYQGEMAAVTAVALACALMPMRGATETVELRPGAHGFATRSRQVAAFVVLCSILGTVSTVQFVANWSDHLVGRSYFRTLLREADAAGRPYPLVDQPVPKAMLLPLLYPDNLQSKIMRRVVDDGRVRFVTASVDELRMTDEQGRIWPAAITPVRSAPAGPSACGYEIDSSRTIPLDGPVAFGGWWARVAYYAAQPVSVHVTLGDTEHDLVLRSGIHAFYVAGDNFDSIRVSPDISSGRPRPQLCVGDVVAGRAEPVKASQ